MKRAVARLTRSRVLARHLFGLALPPLGDGEHYFDATTLALLRVGRRRVPRGSRVLDLGTGSAAVLGLWFWRHRACRVTCTEIDPALAARARESIERNGASLPLLETSLFDGISGEFDVALFNPPYVPTQRGRERGLPDELRTQWDGGADGTTTIRRFVEAFAATACVEHALLGVNRRHVPRDRLRLLLAGRAPVEVRAVDELRWPPVDVYDLVRRKSPSASTSSPVE